MNTGFSSWNDKDIKDDGPIDPNFDRHQDSVFANVDEVTVAAVANVQQQDQQGGQRQQQVQHSHQIQGLNQGSQNPQSQQVSQQQAHQGVQQQQQQQQASLVEHLHQQSSQSQEESPEIHDHSSLDDLDKLKRRPVSTTKRAAQNRSAQKAFRLRKEKYIKELEEQAAEVQHLKQTIEDLRAENLQLRDYTLALQSRVIELSPSHPPQQGQQDHVPPPAAVFSGNSNKMFTQDK